MMEYENRYNGIRKVFWGYFFLYFNINIESVSILPSFVGYLLFLSAIGCMEEEERELSLLRPLGGILAAWHGVTWLISWGGVTLDGRFPVVDILMGLINLYFHFQLLTNMASIARKHQPEDYSLDAELLRYRTVQTVILTAMILLGYVSEWFRNFGVVAALGMAIVYLIAGLGLMKNLHELKGCLPEEETVK